MKAAPQAQRRLLDLQALDTNLAQLEHRRRTLPELKEIAGAQGRRTALSEEIVAARTRSSDLEGELAKAEADLVPVRERLARNQKRVDDGSVSDPKALRSMTEEIEHLHRRISDLEDAQLEVMERSEAAQGELAELTERRASDDAGLRDLVARRDEAFATIDADIAERTLERGAVAAELPADLLALYTKIAAKGGGVGAAELQHGRCGGCQLEANSADLNRYRAAAPDDVLRCEECNRILVRTGESGL
ncbi:zinc ribbon domain-containing protein [Nigerium massiliense]|uniref:zinc ribbon domain-containing protein n=1 Tax=Nigerium massiliense TaxID=1522317 RepID=UPI00058AD1C7|nr:C4-type zinc ribbon domain-containing protein [Nigerium massiliense]